MSNNSNNIYNILGKLEALKPTAQEKHAATVKAIYESVEAQGSIIEGVDAVQAKLAEAFAAEKANNPFAIGMAAAKKQAGITKTPAHNLPKKVVTKGHKIAKKIDVEEGCTCSEGVCAMHEDAPGEIDIPTASQAPTPSGSPAEPQGSVTVSADPDSGHIDPSEYIEEDDLEEAEITRTDNKTVHRKTEFPGYPADDIDDLDDLRGPGTGKRGRPRKHAAKAPTGLGRGRPTKAKAPTFSKQADPFGRVSGTVPSGKKGTVHTMAESMETLGRRLIEGINFSNMMKETDQNIDELMNELQNDIKEYKATGHCSDKLKDFMQVHAHSKKQMADETAALVAPKPPMAPAGGIHGNFMDTMSAKDQKAKMNPPRTLEDVTMEEELNELAKLAGLGEATRGSYIKQQDTAAEKAGKDKFHAFGQEFDTDKVEEEEETDEGNAFGNEVRKAKADGIQPGEKIEVDGKTYPVKESTSFDGDESSDFNISTSMSSDGDKNVTVSATGEHAASLLQMLRIAGLGGGDKAQELQQPQQQPGVEVISIDGEEGIEEESIDVAQPKVAPQNAPNEKYGTIKNITTQGDDLNREKRQDPATANKAANPMTNAQSVLKSVAQLESKLSAEYESIKKVSK